VTVETLEVAGRSTTVTRAGRGEPLVYLHGLADLHSARQPDDVPAMLTALAADREVIAPALPGYVGTEGTGVDRIEEHVFALLDLLDALGLPSADVVGHSLGGWIAAETAVRHPHRFRRLVLVAPLGLHVPGTHPALFFGAVAPRGVGGFGEPRSVLFADPDSAVAKAVLPDEMTTEQQLRWFGGLAGAAAVGWTGPQLQDRRLARHLHRATVPTLVIGGESDRIVLADHVAAWTAGLPDACAVTVAGGHALVEESPDVVAAEIASFLAAPPADQEPR
jgi:pimeloyl-ACP methyl ester carboxylesterase